MISYKNKYFKILSLKNTLSMYLMSKCEYKYISSYM